MRRIHLLAVVASIIGLAAATASAQPNGTCNMDFEGLPAGLIVTELDKDNGINGCNVSGKVTLESQNSFFSTEAAIVFDSDCPVVPDPFSDCGPADLDLGTPNEISIAIRGELAVLLEDPRLAALLGEDPWETIDWPRLLRRAEVLSIEGLLGADADS